MRMKMLGVLRTAAYDRLPSTEVETTDMLSSGSRSLSSGWEGGGVEAMVYDIFCVSLVEDGGRKE